MRKALHHLVAPTMSSWGFDQENPKGRLIRGYDSFETRMMIGDFYAKMALQNQPE